jgi:hypothetical protein
MTVKRTTQVATDVPYAGTPKTRATQVQADVPYAGSPKARVTQVVAEVVYEQVAGGGDQVVWVG